MMGSVTIPFEPQSQRALAGQWSAFVGSRPERSALERGALERSALERSALERATGVRSVVRDSWYRSLDANVRPDLPAAPMALDENSLIQATTTADWLAPARDAVARHQQSVVGEGHVLTLFDERARMLHAEGDAGALAALAEINFRPGGLWSEDTVGTNGPGTALANGAPTHIVGAEHYCERWQVWHCAAVPIRDAATRRTIGALDISGQWERAHPHTLALALALGVAIEQALIAREEHRRYLILQRHAVLAARYPGDPMMAVDRSGRILTESSGIARTLSARLAAAVGRSAHHVWTTDGSAVTVGDRDVARWFPVVQGRTLVGGCIVLERREVSANANENPLDRSDIRSVATRLFQSVARDLGRMGVSVAPEALDAFEAYHWPGSIRELKHVIRRVLSATSGVVDVRDLPHVIREAYAGATDSVHSAIDSEDARLIDVVRESRTMAEAAARLGITRSTLYRRMERFGLKPKRVVGHE